MIDASLAAPAAPPTRAPAGRDHFVQFYESDDVLVEEVAGYLRHGVQSGSTALAIVTKEHRDRVLARWSREGFDFDAAAERGQLVMMDAGETLSHIMVDGMPDPARFDVIVGTVLRQAIERHGDVMAFGEMVAVLWSEGRQAAALQVEELWNRLAAVHRFSLYCAYPLRDCATAGMAGAFEHVCEAHSHVIPGESMRDPKSEDEQVRWIARLQQRAAALSTELALRQETQAQLADRERELADFVENAVVGLHRVGPDGTILWANRAELEMLGYEPHEYIGRNIAEFHTDAALLASILETLGRGGRLRDQPATMRCKDGSERHVLINSNARIQDGRLVYTRCFTRDVTERWLAQEALRERSAMLHLAMQGARCGHWVGDLEHGTIKVSAELAGLIGWDEAADAPWDAFVARLHPSDQEPFRRALDEAIAARRRLAVEVRVPVGGESRWIEVRGEAVYDAGGRPVRLYGLCLDVTARKRDEQLLSHLQAMVQTAQDAIISKTLEGTVVSWNPGATRLFGYEAAEMVGRSIATIIPAELAAEEAGIIAKMRAGERIDHFETRRVAKDGSVKRVSLSVSPIHDAEGRIVGASKIAREIAG
ncbi:MAG TPA: PAS domain S-box protein [Usitatibacter sp.]|nr:PAS domain S-box protein [Usitatibacter sp.]